jgi:hypothetical protein
MSTSHQLSILEDIVRERERQDLLFGTANEGTPLLDYRWLAVIGKTFGDVNAVMLFMKRGNDLDLSVLPDLRKNLIEVAASAVQMIEKIDQHVIENS